MMDNSEIYQRWLMFRIFEKACGSKYRQRFFDWQKSVGRFFKLYKETDDTERATEYLEWLTEQKKLVEEYLGEQEPPF